MLPSWSTTARRSPRRERERTPAPVALSGSKGDERGEMSRAGEFPQRHRGASLGQKGISLDTRRRIDRTEGGRRQWEPRTNRRKKSTIGKIKPHGQPHTGKRTQGLVQEGRATERSGRGSGLVAQSVRMAHRVKYGSHSSDARRRLRKVGAEDRGSGGFFAVSDAGGDNPRRSRARVI